MSFHIGVHALILDEKMKVLVTKRSELENYMPLLWDIPGGSVEMGETVEQALVREVKEETNIIISPIKPIYVYSDLSWVPNRQLFQIIYKCTYNGGDIILDPEEHDEYKWVDYEDIGNLKCIAFLENLMKNYSLDPDGCLRTKTSSIQNIGKRLNNQV